MSKRKSEFDEYSKVKEEALCADLHGIVTSLSPIKKARAAGSHYYDGEICDGVQTLRFVGFLAVHKRQLDDFFESKKSVFMNYCQIKRSIRDSDKLEVIVKGCSKICKSEKKFDVSEVHYKAH